MDNKELIKQARQSDLVGYLLSIGEPLIRNGHRYRHKEHSSLVFTQNAYYWNSRQEHGNAVDYLTRHKAMTFENAVIALTGFTPLVNRTDGEPPQPIELKISNDYKRAIAYLNKARSVNYALIKHLIDTKHLYQEQGTNNAIFPMYDELGECIGAELQGTLSGRRFKGVTANSKYGYGFNVRYGNNFKYVLFFESAIDLLSFIDLKTNYDRKSLDRCLLVSMAGLKLNIVKHTVGAFLGDLSIVLCVDNDNAGEEFINTVKGQKIGFAECRPKKQYKDWNDQLNAVARSD